MNPIAIFRHAPTEGPGYFAEFLDTHRIPWKLIAIDAGDAVPDSAQVFSGLVFMGGPMSVNDDLPWIAQVEALIRDAVARDIPVKEIGWSGVAVDDSDTARAWFGETKYFNAFHWHGETFALPQGATHLLSSAYCTNQAWSIGKHLALQCHVEMTSAMIAS